MNVPHERRIHPRLNAKVRVLVASQNQPGSVYWVSDMSEGGAFLHDDGRSLAVGDTLQLRVLGLLRDKASAVPARIVRRTLNGVGLRFMH